MKQESKIQVSTFLSEIKWCSKFERIKNKDIREKYVFQNLNSRLKDYKLLWKEHLQRTSYSRLAKHWKYTLIGHEGMAGESLKV